jgi:hypothetical protein
MKRICEEDVKIVTGVRIVDLRKLAMDTIKNVEMYYVFFDMNAEQRLHIDQT